MRYAIRPFDGSTWAAFAERNNGVYPAHNRRENDRDPPPLPGWRITCLSIDKRHRGQGIARGCQALPAAWSLSRMADSAAHSLSAREWPYVCGSWVNTARPPITR